MTVVNDRRVFFSRAVILLAVALTVALTGCDQLYRLLHKQGAEEKALVGDMAPFEQNPTVAEIQLLLKVYGYSPGKIDGMMGLRTRDAIERFQKDNGLEPSRFVDQATWPRLREFKDLGLVQDNGLNAALVQQLLAAAGQPIGTIDGKFGPRTELAVKAFQKAHGLKEDGKVGYRTLQNLARYLPVPAPVPVFSTPTVNVGAGGAGAEASAPGGAGAGAEKMAEP